MKFQVLTEAPGGYVALDASEVVRAIPKGTYKTVRVHFRNGDFVILSGQVARTLDRLGILLPYR
jgi:hypothetical protein